MVHLTRVAGENVGRYVIGQGSLSLPSGYALTFIVDHVNHHPSLLSQLLRMIRLKYMEQ